MFWQWLSCSVWKIIIIKKKVTTTVTKNTICYLPGKYTLKNKGASKGSSSDAIEEAFLVPQRTIQSKVL